MSLIGHTIKGYVLREQLGDAGGFGMVYRAEQPQLKREVAIKVILPQHANNPDFIRRFEVEAELIARLEHSHIVPIYDYWRDPDGAFIVMRLLSGGNLSTLIEHGPLTVRQTSQMLDQITSALAFAHRRGVIHCDIKPSNVLLDDDGQCYLADFGIAKDTYAPTANDEQIAITPAYAAPEQFKGNMVSPQTDIYGLGVMLYEMLLGHHPYSGASISELVNKTFYDRLPSLTTSRPDLPDMIDEVIERATEKEVAKRYPDVLTMANAFHTALGVQGMITAIPDTPLIPFIDENPYKGLHAFQESDQDDFFGRQTLVEHLLGRLKGSEAIDRFLAVVGPSGSGKSSVVKAGLIPAIRDGKLTDSEHWFVVEMFPGTHPLEELEAALLRIAVNPPDSLLRQIDEDARGLIRAVKRILPPDDHTELLLVIDQFEEVFTLTEDENERAHFLNSLLAAVDDPRSRLRIVITLRADFYDRPLGYGGFGDLIRQRTEVVLPMKTEELEQAIVQPVLNVGGKFETGLVPAIINDVNKQPGTLPLLQYALYELFRNHVNGQLTLSAYQAAGGVTGSLAKRAEDIYEQLDTTGKEAARQVFLRLVTLGEGTEDTRRRVPRAEIPSGAEIVIERYGQSRLLTFDRDPSSREPTLEVAHEALIRTWARLREWIDDSRDELRTQRRLMQEMLEWQASGRDPGLLASETRLAQFEEWAQKTTLVITDAERAFLDASILQQDERRHQEEARKAHEAELEQRAFLAETAKATRARRAATVAGLIGVVAALIAVIAFATANDASQRMTTAENQLGTATIVQGDTLLQKGTADAAVVAAQATVGGAQVQASTLEFGATFSAIEIDHFSTLNAGSIVIPLRTQTPGIFEPTLTAVAALKGLKPEVEKVDSIPMVKVPSGCFFMGSVSSTDTQPIVQQCFSTPFWIAQTEVTNAQYKAFIDDGGYNNRDYWTQAGWEWRSELSTEDRTQPGYWNDETLNQPQQPVVGISWYEAAAYTTWLTQKLRSAGLLQANEIIRLPSEAEWEYAARGPDSLQYPWGNDWVDGKAVTSENGASTSAAVGSIPDGASWVGALDMSGNVWEWMNTIYDFQRFPYPFKADDGRETLESNADRVLRGGSWNNSKGYARTPYRLPDLFRSGNRLNNVGFRVVRLMSG